jgi:hypothetical protein
MTQWFRQLDRLLRGEITRPEALREGNLDVPVAGLATVAIILGMLYGLCMGVFSLTGSGSHAPLQILASAIKVPALFFFTLLVTFPSLYVFNALVGSRLVLTAVLRLLVAAIAIMLTVLASLGPIVAFFALTTTSYPFMKLLNVAVFMIAGFLGGGFLLRTLHRLTLSAEKAARDALPPPPPPRAVPPLPAPRPGRAARYTLPNPAVAKAPAEPAPGANVQIVFRVWVIVFGLVGAQMAWIMRPFIGDPTKPFEFFRPRSSNFFEALFHTLDSLFSWR